MLIDVVLELLDVLVGLLESLAELSDLLLLALADSIILLGLLALLEGILGSARMAWGADVAGSHGAGSGCECASSWANSLDDGLTKHFGCG